MQRLLLLSCLVLAASCLAQPQIIYYKFDDAAGAAARNHAVPGQGWSQGAFSAAPLWNTTTPQIPPAAVNNAGQNRRLTTGYSLAERNGQALTIELWFRTTGNGYQDFVNDSVNFGLWLFNGRIQLRVGGTTLQSSNTNNNDGAWRYVAVTRNAGNAWSLYWGTTAGGLSSVSGNIAHTFNANAMGLLYWQGGSPATYNGEMDEFRLWSVQRSAAELQANRFAPFLTQDIDVTDPAGIFVKHQGQAGFTNVASGMATDYTFTIRNGRPAGNVNFSGVSLAGITGATANVTLQPGTIAPGATTTFTIQVTPTAPAFSFTVNINNDRSPNPYTFTFTGIVSTGRPEMLYYRFNEGSGTTTRNDASPGAGNNPATFTAVSWTTTPNARLGASAVQNTSNLTTGFSCTQLPRPEFTLEFWVFKPNGNSTNTICGDGTSFRVYRQNATLRIQSGPAGGDQDISTGVSLTNNGWTHIAIVSNPGVFGLRVYRDGVQAFESVNYTFPFANAPLTVMSNAGANNLTGRLDEFRFWAHARSAADILADHTRELLARLQVERPAATILATGGADVLGGVPTGAPLTLTYTLRNIGSTGLLLGTPAVAFSGATNCNVNVAGNPSGTLLAASATTTALVQVTPLAAAVFSFQLTFASNDPDVPNYVVNVSGTGVPGEIQLERPLGTIIADNGTDPAGSPVAGLPLVLTYTVRNVAAAGNINLGAFTVDGLVNCGVALTPPGLATLAPGGSTTMLATVTPTAPGAFSFALHLASDDLDENPYDINASGTALAPPEVNVQHPAGSDIADGGVAVVAGTVAGASSLMTFTIQNLGGSTLTLTGRSVINLVNCSVVPGSFGSATVAAGGSTTLAVAVTPAAAGTWSFDLDIDSDDGDENPYDIAVSGNAVPGGEINVERPALTSIVDGGSDIVTGTVAGAPTLVTYTIRNQGTATLTLTGRSFANNVNCGVALGSFSSGTVAVGGTATLGATITPLATGGWSFDLGITSDDVDEATYDIAVSGTAAPGGEINVERPALTTIADGGSDSVAGTVAGAPTVITYTIRNQGTATLALTGQGFTAAGNCGVSVGMPGSTTLGPAATTTLGVTITPVAAGGWSFTLQVFSDDLDEAAYDILVSGNAAPGGEIELQRPVGVAIADGGTDSVAGTVATFGTVATYTIRNFGTAALTITGQGFASAGNCGVVVGAPSSGVLAPGGSATLDVTVTPVTPGGWNFTLQVLSDDLDESSYDILVSGTAASNSSVTGVSVSPDNGGPLTVTAMANGPAATSIDVVVSYSGGANAGPPVLISTSAGTISGNVVLGVPANTALTLRWDAYATERHVTDFAYILTLSPFIGVQPGTPGSSAPFSLQRDGGWAKHETPTQICGPVFGHAAVFDTANDRMVIFGGKRNGLRTRETWVFERDPAWGPGWRKLSPGGTIPPELQYASAIYDAANGRMVVFGGQSNTGNRNQTWELDLTRGAETWSQIAVASPATPSIRFGAAMVYDAAGQRALMHGGQGVALLADVWSLSLNPGTESWGTGALATLGTPPSARMGHAAALDAAGNRMVIYGGNTGTGTVADMHELALGGTPSWSLLSASVAAGARYFSTWTHDTANNALVVQSGFNGGSYLGNSWIMPLQGPSQHVWTALPNDPFAGNGRVVGGVAFDPVRQQALFFGGLPSTGVPLTAFSVLDLSGTPGWQADQASAPPETAPAARWGASMVFDSTHNRVVLFGGKDSAGMFNDVWVLSRATATAPWVKFSTTGSAPVKRVYHTAVYDAAGQRLIVFGGHDSTGVKLADLWALDLSGPSTGAWTQLSAGGGPVARITPVMVHDTVQDRLVMFGGLGATYLNDTWVWNLAGSGWVQLAPTGTLPTARYSSRAMFDASLNRMVVVAGLGSGGFTSQVFALDLTLGLEAWADISAPVAPIMPARSDFAMGFAANGRKAWLFGGYNGGQFADVWELDVNGPTAVWAQLTVPATGPLARHALPGCLDGAGRLVIGFGYTNGPVSDLWALDPANLAAGWVRPVVELSPSKLVTSVVALDVPRNRLIAFGGLAAGQPVAGLWQLDLSTPVAAWQPLAATGTGPSGRRTASMVYDAPNDRMVIFGGRTGVAASTIVGEVWALNLAGTPSWSLLATSGTAPGPRAQHIAVVDGANRMIVWGGSDNLGILQNSAFALDLGTLAWTNLAPAGAAPLARVAAGAAFDAQGNRVIIYGGSNNGATGILNVLSLAGSPTWTTQAVTGTLPPALFYHSMVYDNAARRILLFGGFSTAAENGLYVLDLAGAAWTRVTPPVATPQARWAHGAVWHPADNRLCIVGGYVDGEIPAVDATGSSDVWFWGD